jgi:hypothetical protein
VLVWLINEAPRCYVLPFFISIGIKNIPIFYVSVIDQKFPAALNQSIFVVCSNISLRVNPLLYGETVVMYDDVQVWKRGGMREKIRL